MNENLQTVVDSVNAVLKNTNLTIFTESVIDRLVSFGYEPAEEDALTIAFSMQKAKHHILNEINHSTIPDGLVEIFVDMICGEMLNAKFLSGQLELNSLDLDGMIQSVQEGDTTVSFRAEGSDEAKMERLLNWLIQGKGCDLLCYRKLRW